MAIGEPWPWPWTWWGDPNMPLVAVTLRREETAAELLAAAKGVLHPNQKRGKPTSKDRLRDAIAAYEEARR